MDALSPGAAPGRQALKKLLSAYALKKLFSLCRPHNKPCGQLLAAAASVGIHAPTR
jgi:hypothetical protein